MLLISDDHIYIWWCGAPPYVDEVIRDHGACQSVGVRRSGVGPIGSILRSPSSPAANVNHPKVN
jgi:hypothetical protein